MTGVRPTGRSRADGGVDNRADGGADVVAPAAVGVNLTWLVPGVVGGSEEYTVRLLEAAGPRLPPGLRLRLYARPDLLDAHPGLGHHHEVVLAPVLPGGRAARVVQEATWLAGQSRADAAVHHAGGTVPVRRTVPSAVTVHDLQPLEQPENFHPVKRRWLAWSLPRAVAAARLVLCPSGHTADRLREVLRVPADRIRVVHHGHRLPALEHDRGADGPQHRFGRYVLYPAIAYPHKRHIDVVRALARLGSGLDDLAVVFTGRPGPETAAITAEAARLGVAERVVQLGRVPWADLAALYRSAVALVFPSAYEGFGNPAVEAMGLGCPVVASDAGALPEVISDAGLLAPIGDVDAIAAAITRVATEPGLAATMRTRGRARAREFDVDIAADRLLDVYRELAGPSRP
ncbi:MAG: glycosyltransferase family 1 protein [Actinomycetota bacterium]